ncbi:hypothetical protein CR532_04730 (plasmid) [Candidatus Borreliella tachyglossi]|uniref:Lipoprotein n=1 Tax=Candidatus Borreliella tachyglossi TaxID=1964448 RepID=A0A2S1LYE6_9SPIR|nr:hypothetical protein [Candidatus Borreliella tachyglossi]AWG43306.1 hypothetical protein CR532_04730 [Candidatus Borreliella tachyglossi]
MDKIIIVLLSILALSCNPDVGFDFVEKKLKQNPNLGKNASDVPNSAISNSDISFDVKKLLGPLDNLNISVSLKQSKTIKPVEGNPDSIIYEIVEDIRDEKLQQITILSTDDALSKLGTNKVVEVLDKVKEQNLDASDFLSILLEFKIGLKADEKMSIVLNNQQLKHLKEAMAQPDKEISLMQYKGEELEFPGMGLICEDENSTLYPRSVTYSSSDSKIIFKLFNGPYSSKADGGVVTEEGYIQFLPDYVKVLENLGTADQIKDFVTKNQSAIVSK